MKIEVRLTNFLLDLTTYDPRTDEAYFRLAEHFEALQVKYEQVAGCPWRFVSPDRPEPDWPKDVARE